MDYVVGNEWDKILANEFKADYFKKIIEFIEDEYKNGIVYPSKQNIFSALRYTDFDKVKVCILGQDPYHGAGQANGMAFAVENGVRFPPSLANIFKELRFDLGINPPKNGNLIGWAKQGVLLLNCCLTVKDSQPLSHEGIGWHRFTDAIICALSKRQAPVVFVLWGASAISKTELIGARELTDNSRHFIISSAHPSPLSAYRGFFGSKPFSKINKFLQDCGIEPIDWSDFEANRASYLKGKGKIFKIQKK